AQCRAVGQGVQGRTLLLRQRRIILRQLPGQGNPPFPREHEGQPVHRQAPCLRFHLVKQLRGEEAYHPPADGDLRLVVAEIIHQLRPQPPDEVVRSGRLQRANLPPARVGRV